MRPEAADLGHVRADLKSEGADLKRGKAILRLDLEPGGVGGRKIETKSPCVESRVIGPPGAAA